MSESERPIEKGEFVRLRAWHRAGLPSPTMLVTYVDRAATTDGVVIAVASVGWFTTDMKYQTFSYYLNELVRVPSHWIKAKPE